MLNTHVLMDSIRKVVLSGSVPALKSVAFKVDAQPHTTGDTIVLPVPDARWKEGSEDVLLWRYYAEHELGHEDPTNAAPHWRTIMLANKDKLDSLTKVLWNLLSDHVQERNRIGQYVGRDEVLLRGRAAFLRKSEKEAGGYGTSPLSQAFEWDTMNRRSWNPHIAPVVGNPDNDAIRAKMSELVDMAALKNEQDCYDAAVKLRTLWPKAGDEKPEPGEGKSGAGGKSKKVTEKEIEKLMEEVEREAEKRAVSHHDDKPMEDSGEEAGYGTECPKKGSFAARPPKFIPLDKLDPMSTHHAIRRIGEIASKSSLPSRLKAWLVGKRAIKESRGYRRGRLDTGSLTRVLSGQVDVFRQKEDTRAVNAAVFILVDASGSMIGMDYHIASASAVMVADALSAVSARVRVEAFTEHYPEGYHGEFCVAHGLAKDWDERFNKTRMIERLGKMEDHLYDNSDGESLLWAYHQISKVEADRKLLLVISDGSPCGRGPHFDSGVSKFTREVITLVEADKSVRTVAVGISGHSAAGWYKNVVDVRDIAALPDTLLSIAKAVYE